MPDDRRRYRKAARRWGLGILACLAAVIAAFVVSIAVPSLLDAVAYIHLALLLALVACTVMLLVRLVQSLVAKPQTEYGSQIAAEMQPHMTLGLHWWEWVAEGVGIIAIIIGGIVLTDVGMQQGWLPRSRPVAEGIMSSFGAVFVITAIMVWAIFRSPAFAGRKRAMLVVTVLAAAASASVGLLGSIMHWRPFASMISGRAAGAILGAVFIAIWLAGYRLTKRT